MSRSEEFKAGVVLSIHADFKWVSLTPEQGNFLFGYYDRCPWDKSNKYHLALKIPQQERLPEPGEKADVGFIERESRKFSKVAETEAWCHQQGSMTLWLQHRENTFIYNDFIQDKNQWRPISRIYDLNKGADGFYGHPVYTISPDGRWAAVLNFNRIPRRGYSYARASLPVDSPLPDYENDGLFIMDLHTGKCRLIASYLQMISVYPLPYWLENRYLWINHAGFNSDSTKVMILFRHSASPEGVGWATDLMTMNMDGSDLRCPLPNVYWSGSISHQLWSHEPNEILVDANWIDQGSQYVVFDETATSFRARLISNGLGPSGHLVFSPDGKWIAADTYPDRKSGIQKLGLVNAETGAVTEIGQFNHKSDLQVGDVRCDLHPRWSADGSLLTVDTIHEGERKIYMLECQL